jgi:hypothetical protein
MKSSPRRVAAIITSIALAVAGSATSSAAADPAGPREGAVAVQALHDALQDAANAGDVEKTKLRLDALEPLLAELEGGQRYEITASSRELADTAGEEAATTKHQIAELYPDSGAKDGLPSVADLLNVLLQRLLLSLSSLVDDLLGGVPLVPIVVPAT